MLAALLTIIATALLCLLAEGWPRWAWAARYVAAPGAGAALLVAVLIEGVEGAVLGADIAWPEALAWLGAPLFRSDALAAGVGAWCLLLGGLCVLKMACDGESPARLALALLTTATLYALVHTTNLLAFAAQVALLAGLMWACQSADRGENAGGDGRTRQMLALGLGAAMLLGAVALVGRASGGVYEVAGLPVPALSVWPLLLLSGFALLWLGCAPLVGWSAGEGRGAFGALTQSLIVCVPVVALLLRLQTLFSAQALAGAIPSGWAAFTVALAWVGAATAFVGAARSLLTVGTPRFFSSLTACWVGLSLWALALDTPVGRYSAVALLLAWGAGRVSWELAEATLGEERWGALPRAGASMSLAAAPLSAGFVGVWLLGAALAERARPALALLAVGILVLAAIGVIVHFALSPLTPAEPANRGRQQYAGWAAIGLGISLAVGGALPGLWLPLAGGVAGVAGGNNPASVSWTGVELPNGAELPLFLLAIGIAALGALGWIVARIAGRGGRRGGALLPPALARLQESRGGASLQAGERPMLAPLFQNPPAPIRISSLAGVERVFLGVGGSFSHLLTRGGLVLGRLEGRYYLPLALVLTLVLLLAVTR